MSEVKTETMTEDWLTQELQGGADDGDHSLEAKGAEPIPDEEEGAEFEFEDNGGGGNVEVAGKSPDGTDPAGNGKSDSEAHQESDGATKTESTVNPEELEKLHRENETLQKRLHDTQSAFHKETKRRAEIAKELEELKAAKDTGGDDDDWFSDDKPGNEDTKARLEKLEADLKAADESLSKQSGDIDKMTKDAQMAAWDEAAAPVIAKHKDFKTLVYDELVPLLDEKNGNPSVRKEFVNLPAEDRNPEGYYKFAQKIHDRMDFERDPEAYRERIRSEVRSAAPAHAEVQKSAPVGKSRLDMTNSVTSPGNDAGEERFDMDEFLFGEK